MLFGPLEVEDFPIRMLVVSDQHVLLEHQFTVIIHSLDKVTQESVPVRCVTTVNNVRLTNINNRRRRQRSRATRIRRLGHEQSKIQTRFRAARHLGVIHQHTNALSRVANIRRMAVANITLRSKDNIGASDNHSVAAPVFKVTNRQGATGTHTLTTATSITPGYFVRWGPCQMKSQSSGPEPIILRHLTGLNRNQTRKVNTISLRVVNRLFDESFNSTRRNVPL